MPKEVRDVEIDDKEIGQIEAIIRSMTREERARPEIIEASRRTRIATGSGTTPARSTQLIKQFQEMSKMMKRMGGFGSKKAKKSRKRQEGQRAAGRVTQGRAPLRLPDLDLPRPRPPAGPAPVPGLAGPVRSGRSRDAPA